MKLKVGEYYMAKLFSSTDERYLVVVVRKDRGDDYLVRRMQDPPNHCYGLNESMSFRRATDSEVLAARLKGFPQ